MNPALIDVQARLQQHVLGQADAGDLVDGDAAHAAQRLGIYRNAYRIRLCGALADAYEKTRLYLGDERFERAGQRYIDAHPPVTRSLRWFGDRLAAGLAQWLPAEPAVAELARLDWTLRAAFDGPDAPLLDTTELSAVPAESWSTLGLVLHPTACLLAFSHNTVAIWQALNDGMDPPPLQRGDEAVTWLIWRKGLQPHFRSLHPLEAELLRGLLDGESFAAACARAEASQADDDGAVDSSAIAGQIGGCLRQWLEDELLSAMVLGPSEPLP